MIFMFKMIHYCLQMSLKNLEVNVLKYKNFMTATGLEHSAIQPNWPNH